METKDTIKRRNSLSVHLIGLNVFLPKALGGLHEDTVQNLKFNP